MPPTARRKCQCCQQRGQSLFSFTKTLFVFIIVNKNNYSVKYYTNRFENFATLFTSRVEEI